jgi:two-component system, OmpR family, KDP operon response regulator KdpE
VAVASPIHWYRPCVASILIIEDDQRIRATLATRLSERGHDVETVATAMDGVSRAVSGDFEVVVLDLGLPDLDGTEALRMIRAVSQVPVVVATARDDEADIISVLDAGADDYVIKPYSADHLAARMRAVLRRSSDAVEDDTIVISDLRLDLNAHEATLAGEPLELTARAFDLLAYLASRPGKLVSKRELLAEVWRQPYGGADKTVDVHISWLRKELGETAADPKYLHTRRGVGVRLVNPEA